MAGEFRPPKYSSPQRHIDGQIAPSFGPLVARWIERSLVHGEGDMMGQPIVLEPFQHYILNRSYEYDPTDGRLLYDRVLIGMPSGNSKTELEAAVGLSELLGPIAPLSPHVVVSAASWDQANKLFGAARDMLVGDGAPLRHFFKEGEHVLDDRILRPDRAGKLRRIAAVAGTNDGDLPTNHIGDELHEWLDARERVFTIYRKALNKRDPVAELHPALRERYGRHRRGGLQIGITTAGASKDTLLGRLYNHGKQVARGEVADERFLILWWEASDHWDLDKPDELLAAILEANPAAGSFLRTQTLIGAYHDPTLPRHEFDRYHFNRWTPPPKAWLSSDQWMVRARTLGKVSPPPPAGTPVVIGFDGSYNRDSTALVGCTLDDYVFEIAAWERDNRDPAWTVPRVEVDAAVAGAFQRWKVLEMAADPPGWQTELEGWEREFGTRTIVDDATGAVRGSGAVVRFETNITSRMGPACDAFYTAVVTPGSGLSHDGSAALARHIEHCHTRETRHGALIVKDRKDSPRKIDRAVAAVIARARARWHAANESAPDVERPRVVFH